MKNLIKERILLLFCLLIGIQNYAQSGPDINQQMWDLLHKIKLQAPNTADIEPFFWDLSTHTTNQNFYAPMSTDTSTTYNWWALYFEMYHSSYTQYILPETGVVMDKSDSETHNDTIPIGIFDFGYNTLKDNALTASSGTYINYNNDSVWIAPGHQPFKFNSSTANYKWDIFSAAPLAAKSGFRNVTFKINGDFIFFGSTFNAAPFLSTDSVQIDFGDGNGWQYVHLANHPSINVTYPYKGNYFIQVRVLQDGSIPIRYSISRFSVGSDHLLTQPDYWMTDVDGLNVGVYLGCGHDSLKKPIIYLEGIDALEERHVPEIYEEMINQPKLVLLRNYDYDFVVVDWKNSRIDMRTNARYVEGLLEKLMTKVQDTTQFILIGESMGGVIGRWALTEMETSDYVDGIDGVSPPHPKSHNTRLFISIDAPHQGAIIPVSAQLEINIINDLNPIAVNIAFAIYNWHRNASILHDHVFNQPAIEELLIYHDKSRQIFGQYSPLDEFSEFYYDLKSMNPESKGYPMHCKKMALSNGLMDGSAQVGFGPRALVPGDTFLDLGFELRVSILRIFYFNIFQIPEFRLFATAIGTSPIISITYNITYPTIVGCLTNFLSGLPGCATEFPFTLSFFAMDMLPYETMSGGFYPAAGSIYPQASLNNFADQLANFFDTDAQIDTSGGHCSFKSETGVLESLSVSLTMNAEIVNYCFIPYFSSLDYQMASGSPVIDYDILHDNIDTTLSRTRFDVIVGWPTDTINYPELGGFGTECFQHLEERNDEVDGYANANYLDREIGDFQMFLDNLWINRPALFQATQQIYAGNEVNPFYTFVDFQPASFKVGMFSKNKKFIDDSLGGDVVFKAGKEIRLEPGFEARKGCRFWAHIAGQDTCSLPWDSFQASNPIIRTFWPVIQEPRNTNPPNTISQSSTFQVYPNPSMNLFNVAIPVSEKANAVLCNGFGEIINNFDVSGQKQFTLDAGKYHLANGIYFLIVYTGDKIYKEKLIVNY